MQYAPSRDTLTQNDKVALIMMSLRNSRFVSRTLGMRMIHIEKKMESLNLVMPLPAVPKGNFVNYVLLNETTVFLSGHLPQPPAGAAMKPGKVGADLTTEEAYEVAKLCGLNLCATLKHNLGDLDRVKRIVKLTGFVNCVDGYTQQPAVINGCSDLMVQIFGPIKGAHARSAVGTNALPLGVPVEIEAIIEIEKL